MRAFVTTLLAGVASVSSTVAFAADTIQFGPAPSWVHLQTVPNPKPTDAPVAVLLNDQQLFFEPGKMTSFTEVVFRIQNAQGLAAGNLSVSWDPSKETMTVNRLQIRRGDKVIDVLASGQTFQTMRRETNLEAAMLDGTLTANIQPEGLQEGDIVDLATTTEHADPVLKGHSEAIFAGWNDSPIALGHASVSWPKSMNLVVHRSEGLPDATVKTTGNRSTIDLSAVNVEPLIAPNGAPARFRVGRIAEASDFGAWSDVADLFLPLFRDASTISASGPLRDEVEKIRAASADPKQRAQAALQLTQDRIRYVALSMGQGGYVPAPAELTWSRRFGDCKAKTALLLGILASLGIQAEPVLINSAIGDAIADRLPMPVFDHVLVRAHIAGKDYWLDGTRSGDTSLDDIRTPDFGWGLPLVANAKLVHIVPAPLTMPADETLAVVDASAGIRAPAPTTVDQVVRGDLAVLLNGVLSGVTDAQRQEFLRAYFKKNFDDVTMASASFAFDKAKRELHLSMKGDSRLDWNAGYYHVPNSSVGYTADFARPKGAQQDAPFAVAYPTFSKVTTRIKVPHSFLAGRQPNSDSVHETLAGIEYVRSAAIEGDAFVVETVEKSLVPEISAQEARGSQARLRALADEDVALALARTYKATAADLAAMGKEQPASVQDYLFRGSAYMDNGKFNEAITDFNAAHALDASNEWALLDRGIAYAWKRDFTAAEKDLAAVRAINPNNYALQRAYGLLSEQKGDCKAAIEAYTKTLEISQNDNFALGHRALCERSVGNDDQALADSEAALKGNPTWMDLRVFRANIFYLRNDRPAVAKEAELMLKDNPSSDFAYVAAAKIYDRLDRHEDAMKAFDRALAIKPLAYIYVNRAQVRPKSDRKGRLADLDAALKLEPKNPDALFAKAEQLRSDGDTDGALKLYDEALKEAPGSTGLEVRRAALLYRLGRKEEAERILAAERADAQTGSQFNSLCWEKATAGILLESALQDCRDGLRLNPDSGAILDSTAFVLLRLGKFDDAIAEYGLAIAKKAGSASYMGRAIAYARKGDKVHAEADRAQALNLDPQAESRFKEYGVPYGS